MDMSIERENMELSLVVAHWASEADSDGGWFDRFSAGVRSQTFMEKISPVYGWAEDMDRQGRFGGGDA